MQQVIGWAVGLAGLCESGAVGNEHSRRSSAYTPADYGSMSQLG